MTTPDEDPTVLARAAGLRHVRIGLAGLALFVALGVVLEGLHAVKAPFYLDPGSETRRLMLRLCHAHGTLLSLVEIALGLVLRSLPRAHSRLGSFALHLAHALIPLGFGLGALGVRGGDPGPLIALVPAGAIALVVAIAITLRGVRE